MPCKNVVDWITTEAAILQVVVAQDAEDSISTLIKSYSLKETQQEQIDQLLHKYKEVVTERLGKTRTGLLQINTGKLLPSVHILTGSHLHERTVRGGLLIRKKLEFLNPPSSMVPIRKPDGSVRLCLKFF